MKKGDGKKIKVKVVKNMKKIYKRFKRKDGTLYAFVGCPCVCSCAAIGCEGDMGSTEYIILYRRNKIVTQDILYTADRG